MAEAKGCLIIVTADKPLIHELEVAAAASGQEVVAFSNLLQASVSFSLTDALAVIVDFENVPPAQREECLVLRQNYPRAAFFFLETHLSIAPDTPASLRWLAWPLPFGFADQIRSTERPVVFLVDSTLFTTTGVQVALQQAGVQLVSLESTKGLIKFLQEQKIARTPKPAQAKSLWERLRGQAETEPETSVSLGRVVVAFFPDSIGEAQSLDVRIRQAMSEAVSYYVCSLDPLRAAAAALKSGRPAALMRDLAGRIPDILADMAREEKAPLTKKSGRILLVDNYKPTLAALGQALLGAGHEVVTASGAEEAFQRFEQGAFHLAVIGTAIAYAQHSGAEFAQKLRERDPDMRIIFMVDRYPLQAALQGVSQVVELGLDDALLKPVESSRLLFSVERALERRFLILENVRLMKDLQESNRQLAQINDFQKKFFAMVAHDVKNPLAAILGYAEVLGARLTNSPGEFKCAAHIHSAAKVLNLLISDLVDLAAIESGKLRVEIGPLDMAVVVNDVRSRIEIAAQQRKIVFAVEMPATLPPLAGDPGRLGQVIQNLCTNAIQYTREGGKVTVRVEVSAAQVTVSVIDTGIGIAKEDLPRIWERFFQTEEAKKMRKAGFGLGLKIAREIVQRHGGEMGIESQMGVGSRFFFFLPVKK